MTRRFSLLMLAMSACSQAGSQPASDAGAADGSAAGNDAGGPGSGATEGGGSDGAGLDGASSDAGVTAKTLGMNGITILVPLSTSTVLFKATDLADDGAALVPGALFDQLNKDAAGQNDVLETLDQFQITALRFDVCDRIVPGACPAGSDGRLRVVYQPIDTTGHAMDMALHAFYVLPASGMPAVVAELRRLSQVQGEPITSPLKVSPALSSNASGAYATGLRQLVAQHAGTNRLSRLTFLAQPDIVSALAWVVRGVEKQGGAFVSITIPGIDAGTESATLVGSTSYAVTPLADAPAGIALAWQEQSFKAASAQAQAAALAALASIQNPLMTTPNTVQCMTCHTATVLTAFRCADAGVDPLTVPGRYTSVYDLSIDAGGSASDAVFVRGLGWRGTTPLISQRAANETAQALVEMEGRFPVP